MLIPAFISVAPIPYEPVPDPMFMDFQVLRHQSQSVFLRYKNQILHTSLMQLAASYRNLLVLKHESFIILTFCLSEGSSIIVCSSKSPSALELCKQEFIPMPLAQMDFDGDLIKMAEVGLNNL